MEDKTTSGRPSAEQRKDRIRGFLVDPDRAEIITISAIERKANIPQSLLGKHIKGLQPLPEKHLDNLEKVLRKIGY